MIRYKKFIRILKRENIPYTVLNEADMNAAQKNQTVKMTPLYDETDRKYILVLTNRRISVNALKHILGCGALKQGWPQSKLSFLTALTGRRKQYEALIDAAMENRRTAIVFQDTGKSVQVDEKDLCAALKKAGFTVKKADFRQIL